MSRRVGAPATNAAIIMDPSKLNQSITSSTAVPDDQDGCIVLGGKDEAIRYVTRYRIDRGGQRQKAGEHMCVESYCPCCLSVADTSTGLFVWKVISSEAFILTLHMSALVLGVMKEALNLRTVDEDLHFIHSLLETFVTVLVIVIRTVNVWSSFRAVKKYRQTFEVIVPDHAPIRSSTHKRLLYAYTYLAIIVIMAAVACFFMFEFIPGAHLGWTILSNNTALLVATTASNQVLERSSNVTSRMVQDNHKAVIYETELLLTDSNLAQTPDRRKEVYAQSDAFCQALRATELFAQPDYITVPEHLKPHIDTITTMEVVSMV